MTPWLDDGDVKLYAGEALATLREMPSESVQMIMTSPPFWGLRSYIADDHADKPLEIGLEETPDEWCARLVAVFREARRVLRSDGVCWIEVGDTYQSQANSNAYDKKPGTSGLTNPDYQDRSRRTITPGPPPGVKQKDLVGAPWLLAFALRADGWYLRSDTIWARPNPMPESVTDRPTKAHSYVFLLTKSARYFYDADNIREESHREAGPLPNRSGFRGGYIQSNGFDAKGSNSNEGGDPAGRNARSVWSIATEPTPFAHFATFPQALVERCVKAGTSEHGACGECGAPWRRITETTYAPSRAGGTPSLGHKNTGGPQVAERKTRHDTTLGWEPSCDHDAPVVPCRVLDCFMGSGTTALVARRLGRHAIGIELNAEYLKIAAGRLQQPTLWSQPVEQA